MLTRKQRRLFRYAVDLFIELLRKVAKNTCDYRCNDADERAFETFLQEYPSAGETFVRDFLLYQFQSWFNDGSEKDYTHSIRVSWCFGKPAVARWKSNSAGTNAFIVRKGLKSRVNVASNHLSKERSAVFLAVRKTEEKYKAEFYGDKRGLLWCRANTTLYYHKSSYCAACVFKNECKTMLQESYPAIYKLRGYGE